MTEQLRNRFESSRTPLRYVALSMVLLGVTLPGCDSDATPESEYSAVMACVAPRIMGDRHHLVGVAPEEAKSLVDTATQQCWERVGPKHLDPEKTQAQIGDDLSVIVSSMVATESQE